MSNEAMHRPTRAASSALQALIALALLALGVAALVWGPRVHLPLVGATPAPSAAGAKAGARTNVFYPTKQQMAALTITTVETQRFQPQAATDGKIAIDEDKTTPIFPPYSGRILRLFAKPGDKVAAGQPLFTIEAADMVQAQNDFLADRAALAKARSQLALLQTIEKRQHELYAAGAATLKDWQDAENNVVAARNDLRAAEVALEAVRNRLRILGKSNQEIAAFETEGRISPETPIYAPLAGTIVQRKVGPGQYVGSGSSDPVFVIGDLSTVWLVANVRESDAPRIRVGEPVEFSVLSLPGRVFRATISYVAASVDPATRRLQVRADLPNPDGLLKPEMFAGIRILTGDAQVSPAVPRDAVMHEGGTARLWLVHRDGGIELRNVTLGLRQGDSVQVLAGLEAGDRIVTKGSLFIDRPATGET